jgi:hypothetical protein
MPSRTEPKCRRPPIGTGAGSKAGGSQRSRRSGKSARLIGLCPSRSARCSSPPPAPCRSGMVGCMRPSWTAGVAWSRCRAVGSRCGRAGVAITRRACPSSSRSPVLVMWSWMANLLSSPTMAGPTSSCSQPGSMARTAPPPPIRPSLSMPSTSSATWDATCAVSRGPPVGPLSSSSTWPL